MLQLTQGMVSLKQKVRRGFSKLGDDKLSKVEGERKLMPSGSWVVLEPSIWPSRVTPGEEPVETAAHVGSVPFNGSSDSLFSSSPASSAASSIFSQGNPSTSSVLTMPTPLLNAATEAGKAGRCSNEYKVRHLSESDANSQATVTADPWSCGDGPVLVQTVYGYSVIAPTTGRGPSRTTGASLKIGMGMDHYDALAKIVAERTSRKDHEGMVFTSNVYDDLIYDQRTYETWLEWTRGRPAEDRVLWVLA